MNIIKGILIFIFSTIIPILIFTKIFIWLYEISFDKDSLLCSEGHLKKHEYLYWDLRIDSKTQPKLNATLRNYARKCSCCGHQQIWSRWSGVFSEGEWIEANYLDFDYNKSDVKYDAITFEELAQQHRQDNISLKKSLYREKRLSKILNTNNKQNGKKGNKKSKEGE